MIEVQILRFHCAAFLRATRFFENVVRYLTNNTQVVQDHSHAIEGVHVASAYTESGLHSRFQRGSKRGLGGVEVLNLVYVFI